MILFFELYSSNWEMIRLTLKTVLGSASKSLASQTPVQTSAKYTFVNYQIALLNVKKRPRYYLSLIAY